MLASRSLLLPGPRRRFRFTSLGGDAAGLLGCEELNVSGVWSYCREHAREFTLLEPIQTVGDNAIARDVTEQLLRREPDLVALYVAGGGTPGALGALRASSRAGSIVTLGKAP